MNGISGMTSRTERPATADLNDPQRGRLDPQRVGRSNPADREERPLVTREDIKATRAELAQLKRRTTRRTA